MHTSRREFLSNITTGFTALTLLLAPLALRATPTENHTFRVLPGAGKVVVDGKVDDLDLSAGIFACDDVEEQREHFGVWLHAQYDAENLYVLARWIDETPLNNPGQSIADYGFAGGAIRSGGQFCVAAVCCQ